MAPRDRRGFTLLETMVALAMAGVVLVAALGVAAADLRASRRAADVQQAASLADDLLSRAALAPREQVALWMRGVRGHFDPPVERFDWRIRATPVPGEGELVTIRVEVTWPDGRFVADTRVVPPAEVSGDVVSAGGETRR